MGNKKQPEKQSETGEIQKRVRELGDAVKLYDSVALMLRDKLRGAVLKPFRIDPMLSININLDEPIRVDKDISVEIFGKDYLEITGIRIEGQVVTFFFGNEDGEDTDAYRLLMYDTVNTISVWEYYLLSLIANHDVITQIDMEREEANAFLNRLAEIKETGEDDE